MDITFSFKEIPFFILCTMQSNVDLILTFYVQHQYSLPLLDQVIENDTITGTLCYCL